VVWDRPINQPCPNCNAVFLVKRVLRRGTTIRCLTPRCGYLQQEGDVTAEEGAA
jgi:DNA topoisomerase-1